MPGSNGVPDDLVMRLDGVSKFYGEVLGVNQIDLRIAPGITSLVGPNGAGKSTLLNLLAGLLWPTRGSVRVLGRIPGREPGLNAMLGYCAQVDSFPPGMTGRRFVSRRLRLSGLDAAQAEVLAGAAIERVGMDSAADRPVDAYSKGMRQRIKLAQAIAHDPAVLLLDEPLNGLDPMARVEAMDLFRELGASGLHLVISSHILHEVDRLSDRVIMLDAGYVVAQGAIHGVRHEIAARPLQVLVQCADPAGLGRLALAADHVVSATVDRDGGALLISTKDALQLAEDLGAMAARGAAEIHGFMPADDDVQAIYRYLIGGGNGAK